ncbi:MAG: DUF4352 domain-containing protein [Chloroflexi bacterium]|nr:DUF4352 domain-containing protein [Chloroflexota bacterium]
MKSRMLACAVSLGLTLLALVACGTPTMGFTAAAPFVYPSPVGPTLQRVAVLVTIINNAQDDLAVDPTEFAARDATHRIYPADPTATAQDADAVRTAAGMLGMPGLLPLPAMTLRQDDHLTGFVVFDVPEGVRPTQLIFRQSDNDSVLSLPATKGV